MGGGKGGSSGGGTIAMPTIQPSPYEQELARIASDTYNSTDPLRKTYIEDWMSFLTPQKTLRPGAVPTKTPIYGNTGGTSDLFVDRTGTLTTNPYQTFDNTPRLEADQQGNVQQVYPVMPYGASQVAPGVYGTPSQQYSGGVGGDKTITGYEETYSPSDYITQRFNPASLPGYNQQYGLLRDSLENQYNVAMNQALSNTPRGGAMSDALAKLNLARAESVGRAPLEVAAPLITDMLNKSYGAAFNAPQQAIAGLGAANQGYTSTQNALLSAQMQQAALSQSAANSKGSGLGVLGAGLGTVVGSAFGSPWLGTAMGYSAGKA